MPIVENCYEGKVVAEEGDHPLTKSVTFARNLANKVFCLRIIQVLREVGSY